MRALVSLLLVLGAAPGGQAKVFEKCELARLLEGRHGMPREDVKNWVCIAEYESTFNTEAVNKFNWDGSWDYGLFQLNNKYWCGNTGKNVCRIPCSALLDDDLTDDLACVRRIVKDTERWKGAGTGLTAWVAYVNRCQNRDLEEYMAECKGETQPPPGDPADPIDNFIPREDEDSKSTGTEDPITTTISTPDTALPQSSTTASQPSSTTTLRPKYTTASRPSSTTASQSSLVTPSRPSSSTASRPSSATPSRPSSATASRPSSATPNRPSSVTASRPSSATLSRPTSATATRTSSATASRPSSATQLRLSLATASQPSSATQLRPSSASALRSSLNTASRPALTSVSRSSLATSSRTPSSSGTSTLKRVAASGFGAPPKEQKRPVRNSLSLTSTVQHPPSHYQLWVPQTSGSTAVHVSSNTVPFLRGATRPLVLGIPALRHRAGVNYVVEAGYPHF